MKHFSVGGAAKHVNSPVARATTRSNTRLSKCLVAVVTCMKELRVRTAGDCLSDRAVVLNFEGCVSRLTVTIDEVTQPDKL